VGEALGHHPQVPPWVGEATGALAVVVVGHREDHPGAAVHHALRHGVRVGHVQRHDHRHAAAARGRVAIARVLHPELRGPGHHHRVVHPPTVDVALRHLTAERLDVERQRVVGALDHQTRVEPLDLIHERSLLRCGPFVMDKSELRTLVG
jgi:hypothetical protein